MIGKSWEDWKLLKKEKKYVSKQKGQYKVNKNAELKRKKLLDEETRTAKNRLREKARAAKAEVTCRFVKYQESRFFD